jgi:hypothetical protein
MDLTVGLAGSGADRIIVGTAEDEINQALADVGAAGGGSVTLLQGTYSLASGILIDRDNVTFKGAGAGQTILQALPTYPVATPLIQAASVDNFTIQDLTVDGHTNDIVANPIVSYYCTNGVISGCEVLLSENHVYGIWLVLSQGIQVLGNHVDGFIPSTGQEGIESWSSDAVLISGNTVVNIGGAGIVVGSPVTPGVDVEGQNTNIQILDNVVDNTRYGISVGVSGPRSFGQIAVERNTLSNVLFGVRLYSDDGAAGTPDSETATVNHPQSLHHIDISDNEINLLQLPYSIGIYLQNQSSPGAVGFSNISASDNVFSNAAQAFGALGFAQFILAGTAQNVSGSPYSDAIFGSDLANVIDGGAGADAMWGGLGDDTYYVDRADDLISEFANEGIDTVYATSNYTLSANVEMLSLAYGTGIQGTGNAGNNSIWGNGLSNVLDGGGGTDFMAGGLGDDTYYIDSEDDVVSENANEGNDTVFATSSYTLAANLERLSLAIGTGIRATGNDGNNWFLGNALNNVIDGKGGSDTVDYSSATQAVVVDLPGQIALGAQIGTDTLSNLENVRTGSGNDAVAGDGATNVLDGGAGIDTISYYAVSSGVVLDLAGQTGVDGTSTDTLLNFENANGTAYNDAISGTAAANVLDGLGGIDTISYYLSTNGVLIDLASKVAVEGGVTDTVLNFENANGTAYNDAISGDAGANVLNGLGGTDTVSYYASAQGVVIDLASKVAVEGNIRDTILNFENANGSAYNDAISGGAGPNVLDGLGGVDTIGYYSSAQSVTIDLSAGTGISGGVTDTLLNFENANGSIYADVIIGGGGVNVLNGLGGADTLTGGGGFDVYEFWAGQANGDVITDFTGNGTASGDTISLVGFGTAAQGATFTQVDDTQWQIHSGLDGHNEVVKLSNAATVHGSDFFFV